MKIRLIYLVVGFFAGFSLFALCFLSYFSYKGKGHLEIKRFPLGVELISFNDEDVKIQVSNFGYSKESELNITIEPVSKEGWVGYSMNGDFNLFWGGDNKKIYRSVIVEK